MLIFALSESRYIAEPVATELCSGLAALEERSFVDGECKIRPMVPVRGRDVFVIQSLHGGPDLGPHDKLVRLLFLLATLRDHGAARLTAVIPYLAYARKDRRTKTRDPITTRYMAELIEVAGCNRVVTFEVHNIAAFQNAFRCETVHLDTRSLFPDELAMDLEDVQVTVASPDPGGVKRAQLFRDVLEKRLGRPVGFAFMEKRRSAGVMTTGNVVGELEGRTVLILDDMIASGGTMLEAATAFRARGARGVLALAAHGLFVGRALECIQSEEIDRTYVTDCVPPFRLPEGDKTPGLEIVSAAPIFAEAIARLHGGGGFEDYPV